MSRLRVGTKIYKGDCDTDLINGRELWGEIVGIVEGDRAYEMKWTSTKRPDPFFNDWPFWEMEDKVKSGYFKTRTPLVELDERLFNV